MRRWLVNSRWKSAKFRIWFGRLRHFSNLYQIRCDDDYCFSPWYWCGAAGRCHLLRLSAICQDLHSQAGSYVPIYKLVFPYPLEVWGTTFSVWSSWDGFYFYYHTILLPKWNDLTSTYLDQKQKSRLSTLIGLGCQNISFHCLFKMHRFCFISHRLGTMVRVRNFLVRNRTCFSRLATTKFFSFKEELFMGSCKLKNKYNSVWRISLNILFIRCTVQYLSYCGASKTVNLSL